MNHLSITVFKGTEVVYTGDLNTSEDISAAIDILEKYKSEQNTITILGYRNGVQDVVFSYQEFVAILLAGMALEQILFEALILSLPDPSLN